MKNKLLTTALCFISLFLPKSILAQQETMNMGEIYNLCSRFPHNSRCKGFEIPIPLKERSGETVGCTFKFDLTPSKGKNKCKIEVKEDSLTIYQEYGEKIEPLDDRRATQAIDIIPGNIFVSNYRVYGSFTVGNWDFNLRTMRKPKITVIFS